MVFNASPLRNTSESLGNEPSLNPTNNDTFTLVSYVNCFEPCLFLRTVSEPLLLNPLFLFLIPCKPPPLLPIYLSLSYFLLSSLSVLSLFTSSLAPSCFLHPPYFTSLSSFLSSFYLLPYHPLTIPSFLPFFPSPCRPYLTSFLLLPFLVSPCSPSFPLILLASFPGGPLNLPSLPLTFLPPLPPAPIPSVCPLSLLTFLSSLHLTFLPPSSPSLLPLHLSSSLPRRQEKTLNSSPPFIPSLHTCLLLSPVEKNGNEEDARKVKQKERTEMSVWCEKLFILFIFFFPLSLPYYIGIVKIERK